LACWKRRVRRWSGRQRETGSLRPLRAQAASPASDGFRDSHLLQEGWSAVRNGELLVAAEAAGSVFVTADQNLRYQQNLHTHRIAILELPRNQLHILLPLVPAIRSAIESLAPGAYLQLPLP
jgi:hypothetical protein